MAAHALRLESANHVLNHPILLRAARRDEHLAQTLAAYQSRIVATREEQPVVASPQEGLQHVPERTEPDDQSML